MPWTTAALLLWAQAASAQTVIDTVQQLENINNNLSGNYVLGANIDASGFNFIPIGEPSFDPVSGNYIGYFTGTFNGNGYTISNLTINASAIPAEFVNESVGLFAWNAGVVQNLGLANVSISAASGCALSWCSAMFVGGVAGENTGTVTSTYVTGSISASFSPADAGPSYAGGLVGINGGTISQSYSTVSITSLSGSNIVAGGLVGGTIGPNPSIVTNSYWDTQASGLVTSAGGTALTTAQLTSGLPTGFSPSVWASNPNTNNGYPYLLNPVASNFQAMTATYLPPNITTPVSQLIQSQQSALALMNNAIALAQSLGLSVQTQLSPVQAINAVNAVLQLQDWVEIYQLAAGLITPEQFLTPGPWTVVEIAADLFLPDVAYAPTVSNFYQLEDPFEIFSYSMTVQVTDSDILSLAIGEQFLVNSGILDQPSFSDFQVSSINGDDVTFQVWNLTSLPDATPVPASLPLFVSGLSIIALLCCRAKRRSKALA